MNPVMLYVKILLQTLWQCHLDWDENTPRELMPVWEAWASELSSLFRGQKSVGDSTRYEEGIHYSPKKAETS